MSKKKVIKEVFDRNFSMEEMRAQILQKSKEKKYIYQNLFFKYSLPICIFLCGVFVLNNNFSLSNSEKGGVENSVSNSFYINKIENMGANRIDAIEKKISFSDLDNSWLGALKNRIAVPNDLENFNGYMLYTRQDQNSDYTNLNCYVYSYFSTTVGKDVRIAFSNKNKPVRDYFFEQVGKISKINNIELTIYQYEDIYFAEFVFDDYFFDIEVQGLSETEFTVLLESIIK